MSKSNIYKDKRLTIPSPSLFDPHYTEMRQTLDLLGPMANKKYDQILDYGAGNSPYRGFFRYQEFKSADVEQNSTGTIDFIINSDRPKIAVESEQFDLVMAMDVLEHVPKVGAVLNEIHRVLKNSGIFLIKMPFVYREHEVPHDYRRLTEYGLKMLLIEHGFEVISFHKLGNAWTAALTVINERFVLDFENQTFWSRMFSKLFRSTFLPMFNLMVQNTIHEGIYSSLLVVARKKGALVQ